MKQEIIEKLIRECMNEAQKAIDSGNTPFGCIVTDYSGNIVAKAHNKVKHDFNPSAHAEILAIAGLCSDLKEFDLSDYVLFANAESCPMCMACALRAGIRTFYFGAGSGTSTNPQISASKMAAKAKQEVKIKSGILDRGCSKQIETGYAKLALNQP